MQNFMRFYIQNKMRVTEFFRINDGCFETAFINPEFCRFRSCRNHGTFFNRHWQSQQLSIDQEIRGNSIRHIKIRNRVFRKFFVEFLQSFIAVPILLKNLFVTAVFIQIFFDEPIYFTLF